MTAPLAIIAGNGDLPLEIAHRLTQRGEDIFVCAIAGEASEKLKAYPNAFLEWGQVGKLFKLLQQHKINRVMLAGGVVGRPEFSITKMDLGTMLTLPGLLGTLLAGDNEILTGVISIFEKRGFEVCSVPQILPELIASEGAMTKARPRGEDRDRISYGAELTRTLGPYDVGQACVVIGKRAVAIEGVEGTDAMLQRIVEMRQIGRLPRRRCGVLIKAMKPDQSENADLPAIGPATVQAVADANLLGIGVEAGKAIVLDRPTVLQKARELGIFVFGFPPPKPA